MFFIVKFSVLSCKLARIMRKLQFPGRNTIQPPLFSLQYSSCLQEWEEEVCIWITTHTQAAFFPLSQIDSLLTHNKKRELRKKNIPPWTCQSEFRAIRRNALFFDKNWGCGAWKGFLGDSIQYTYSTGKYSVYSNIPVRWDCAASLWFLPFSILLHIWWSWPHSELPASSFPHFTSWKRLLPGTGRLLPSSL